VRAAIPALAVAVLAFLVAPVAVPNQPAKKDAAVAPPPHEKPDPARDLKLVATVGAKQVHAGTTPEITLTLVNTSKTITYPVVKPGDGSECGWREPFVHFTAEQLSVQGKWEALKPVGGGRCGLYDFEWQKSVIDLKPGEKLVVSSDWIPEPSFGLQQPGKVRLQGHYEYSGGRKKSGPAPAGDRGRMGGTPAFSLATEAMEFEVIRPLDLRVKVKRPLKVGVEQNISDVIDVTLTNTTDKPLTARSGGMTGGYLGLCGGGPEANNPQVTHYDSDHGSSVEVKPGQTRALLGKGELANGADGKWTGRKAGTYLVGVTYLVQSSPDSSHRVAVEAFVAVPVEE
jgi:hypothetical protein